MEHDAVPAIRTRLLSAAAKRIPRAAAATCARALGLWRDDEVTFTTEAQFLLVLASLIFVGFGGHAILLAIVSESFTTIPVGSSILSQALLGKVVQWSSMMFLGALLMALPVMVFLLFINVGLGIVTRAAPSLNIFAVGFPAMTLAGFLVLIVSMDAIGGRIDWLWMQGFGVLRDLTGAGRV